MQMIRGLRKKLRNNTIQVATHNIKYLIVTLTKQVKDMYEKNFKFLSKEREELRRWKDLPCSWISKINSENR